MIVTVVLTGNGDVKLHVTVQATVRVPGWTYSESTVTVTFEDVVLIWLEIILTQLEQLLDVHLLCERHPLTSM